MKREGPQPFGRSRRAWIVAGVLAASLSASSPVAAKFVGSPACADCHEREAALWRGSQHQRAMQPANESTVLGDFRDTTFTVEGVTSRFFRRDGRFLVNTDGPDGKLADFEIEFTFGVEPLQQYLVRFPGGRLQALSVAWDSRAGRWFHTYAAEKVDHRDVLHWTRMAQNWNSMCASCHSTDVRKNYDPATDSFATASSEMGVGCEACHGPGSAHVEWARRDGAKGVGAKASGLAVDLAAAASTAQEETCGRCHALRSSLTSGYRFGDPLLDHYLPATLDGQSYFDDGQQREEAFVYGSWLQSRMHEKGLRCSDCHDSHSGKTRASGNALCVGCHNTGEPAAGPHIDTSGLKRKNYDTSDHHHHVEPISCVACHAPKRSYMVVDPRLDHSFRVPRPDLSEETGSPNACSACHGDKDSKWAAEAVARWYGDERQRGFHYGVAFTAARRGAAGASEGLLRVVNNPLQPAIVRASALEELVRYPGGAAFGAIARGLLDADAQVRAGAVRAAAGFDPGNRMRALVPLLSDPSLAVRLEAARELATLAGGMAPMERAAWDRAATELEAAHLENAERPQSGVGLGLLSLARGDVAAAEGHLRRALRLEPRLVPARVNLADLLRQTNRDSDAEHLLREGLDLVPGDPSLTEALALSLVRQSRKSEALILLEKSVNAPTPPARLVYLAAASLADAGRVREAIVLLERATERGGDRDLLLALASYRRDGGDQAGMQAALARLAAVNPDDPALGGGIE